MERVFVPKGTWHPCDPLPNKYTDSFRCTSCRLITHLPYMQRFCGYNYCPYCGALMEE